MGEKRFSLLCSEADVTCNHSVEDDNGWDMLIEFQPKAQPLVALDMRKGVLAVSVQVKATASNSRSVPIRLSNALNYVRSPLPTFIILVVIEDGNYRFFGRHVWTPLIGAWLKAAREADATGRSSANKEFVTLHFDDADERGDEVLDWIRDEIRSVRGVYAAAKAVIVETIGFEKTRGTATFRMAIEGPDDFLDMQLGLKANIQAKRFTFTSERFGIQASAPEVDLSDVEISLTPEGREAILRLQFPKGPSLAVAAKVYGAEHDGRRAARVATHCFQWIQGPGDHVRINSKLSTADVVPIEELALFTLLKAHPADEPIYISVEMDGRTYELGMMSMDRDDELKKAWGWSALTISSLLEIQKSLPAPLPKLSFSQIDHGERGPSILSAIASDRYLRFDFFTYAGMPKSFAAFLCYGYARVGEQIVSVVARRPIIDDRRKGKKRCVGLGLPRILRCLVTDADKWSKQDIEAAFATQRKLMAGEGDILAIGDIVAIIRGEEGAAFPVKAP